MKILLIGAEGQLGRDLCRVLPALGEVVPATRSGQCGLQRGVALDMADADAIEAVLDQVSPSLVVNASAYTAVDRAETESELAFRVNAHGPGALGRACARRGVRLVHYSTDYVFAGDATTPYSEEADVHPQGVYGASKAAGERAILDAGGSALIIRTAWVYSFHGHNFLRTMLRLGSERDQLGIVADQLGSPTPSWLLAESTVALLGKPQTSGILHVATRGEVSWHGFAKAIFDEAVARGVLAAMPVVRPLTTEEYPTAARRPAYSVLDTSKFERIVGSALPDWRQALEITFQREAAESERREP